MKLEWGNGRVGGRRLESGSRRSNSVTGAAGGMVRLQGRGRETLARDGRMGEKKRKEGRKKKRKGGKSR